LSAVADSASQSIAMDARAPPDHSQRALTRFSFKLKGVIMGRGILLWMLGVPLPIILLLAMCSHR
jgi:hypothetical protein